MSHSFQQKSKYILPAINFYSSFDEVHKNHDIYSQYLFRDEPSSRIEDLLKFPRNFVISEPGYGKTRLLQELILHLSSSSYEGIFLDTKKIINESIEEFIYRELQNSNSLRTNDFKLKNNENTIICFDALDEVRQGYFTNTIEKIKYFISKYKKMIFFSTYRWHHIQKHYNLFTNLDFRYVHILPFSKKQVKSYLQNNNITDSDIERIFKMLTFRGRNLIIQVPRYLELLVNYISEQGIKDIQLLTKANLFEHFIYKKLELEDKNLNTHKREVIKRVLEKLALIMEIYQTNILGKDELMTFFDDLKSDLKMSLLNQISIETFYDKTLLKDNLNTIEFDNTEFQ